MVVTSCSWRGLFLYQIIPNGNVKTFSIQMFSVFKVNIWAPTVPSFLAGTKTLYVKGSSLFQNWNSNFLNFVCHFYPPGHARDLRRVAQHRQGGGAHGRRTAKDLARSQEGFYQGISSAPSTHSCWLPTNRFANKFLWFCRGIFFLVCLALVWV